jgi:uncharacterized protein YciI
MFLLLCNYTKPIEDVDKALVAHREYLKEKTRSGELLVAGRREPRSGGILITTHKTMLEATKFVENDPFMIQGVAEFQILEWTPTVKMESMEKFFSAF